MKLLQFARSAMVAVGWSLALNVWAAGEPPLKIIVPAPPAEPWTSWAVLSGTRCRWTPDAP